MTKQEYIDWHIRTYNTPPKRYILEKYFDNDGNMKQLEEVNKQAMKGAKKNAG